jgi:hypothetical protein
MGEFKDRLEKILDHYGITSYRMALDIGTKGANLSNLISGKFNPSFDFLQKVLAKYPEINANWMITGEGPMFNDPSIQQRSHKVPDPDILESKNALIAAQHKTIEVLENKVKDLTHSLREYEIAVGYVKKATVRKSRATK